jgi:plastocyanin
MGRRNVRPRFLAGLALAIAALSTGVVSAARLNAATPPLKTTTVRVVMTDYRFALTPKVVPVGNVVFKIVNKGRIPHNMVFQGPIVYAHSPLVQHGQTYTLKIRVRTPGPYHFVCTLHIKLGMSGVFTAKK